MGLRSKPFGCIRQTSHNSTAQIAVDARSGHTKEIITASNGRLGQLVGRHGSADMLLKHAGEQPSRADKVGGSPRDQQLVISTL